jgi:fumarylacetoacetate (FAA) hydrolase
MNVPLGLVRCSTRRRRPGTVLSPGSRLPAPCERFHERQAHSPLPRAYQWADGSAYVNHVELVRQARGAKVPGSFYHDPLMYQGGSDSFLRPRQDIPLRDPAWGCDMEGEIAAITGDVPMGTSAEEAARAIRASPSFA